MKAAVLYAYRDLRYTDFETPQTTEHEILVKVKATGVCGSDLPRVLGDGACFFPIVLGAKRIFALDIDSRKLDLARKMELTSVLIPGIYVKCKALRRKNTGKIRENSL
jgi:threonine dehydrogenase-like Zn-dependent dehydrogenase